ncbi:MAG: HEAT repeat domain-containing protein [Terriglobia bacterium]
MSLFAEPLIEVVLVLAAVISLGSLGLVAVIIGRRIKHEAYFKTLDLFRDQLKTILEGVLGQTVEYPAALERFQQLMRSRRAGAVERVFLELLGDRRYEGILRRTAEDIGLVEVWRRRLEETSGTEKGNGTHPARAASFHKLRFLTQARSAENLGRVQHRESWCLLVDALHDPHPDVQAVALRSLAAIAEPRSFPALVEQLRLTVSSSAPRVSERALEAALARFPPEFAIQLLPLLGDEHPRVRVVAAQTLRGMLTLPGGNPVRVRERMGEEVAAAILTKLAIDDDPDVRALAAGLLSFFEADDPQAPQCLLRLCDDPEWFVRLQAVRALGGRQDAKFAPEFCARATDRHWRVREAALRALILCGPEGMESVLDLFLSTRDAYAREQIAEELQVSGAALSLMAHLGKPGHEKETETVFQIVGMGKARYFHWLAPEKV